MKHNDLDIENWKECNKQEAVNKTARYLNSAKKEEPDNTPHFLWNAKMRFGKTFAT